MTTRTNAPSSLWNTQQVTETLESLHTDSTVGLDSAEARERIKRHGENCLPATGKRCPFIRFLMQLNSMLIYVLIAAGVGKVFLGEFVDAAVILQLLFTYASFMHAIFFSTPLPLQLWGWILAGGVLFIIVVELEKILLRMFSPMNSALPGK